MQVCIPAHLQMCTPFNPSHVLGYTFPKRVDGALPSVLASGWRNTLIFRYFTGTLRGRAVTTLHTIEMFEGETMLGAIISDIVGSVYEWNRIKTKDFPFFTDACFFTDDSVCTVAVADILLHDLLPATTLQAWCRRYPVCSYGGNFGYWIYADPPKPYHSYGNGAAMRVSPAAFLNRDDLAAAITAADTVTEITHNHPEGMKGARATTHAIWLAFQGERPAAIRQTIAATYDYDLSRTVDAIRPDYGFDESCQGTVPEAITCALESDSFEDAVRNAISLGGDADTLAAIAGAIAEAMHGIPETFREQMADLYFAGAPDMLEILQELYAFKEKK